MFKYPMNSVIVNRATPTVTEIQSVVVVLILKRENL